MNNAIVYASHLADILGVSMRTVDTWKDNGKFPVHSTSEGRLYFYVKDIENIPDIKEMAQTSWEAEMETKPLRPYTSIELFAGAGGLALGMSKAGFKHVLLSEIDHDACATLLKNRPDWHVAEGDVHNLDFRKYRGKIDLLTGGFPCQAFSYAGLKGGFADTRGTLFFELARAVNETNPKVFMCENVKGLASHDHGKTLAVIKNAIKGAWLYARGAARAESRQIHGSAKKGKDNTRCHTQRPCRQGPVSLACAISQDNDAPRCLLQGRTLRYGRATVSRTSLSGKEAESACNGSTRRRLARPAPRGGPRIHGRQLSPWWRQDWHGTAPVLGRAKPHLDLFACPKAN